MIIRTGILSIPEQDEAAITQILQALRTHMPRVLSVHVMAVGNQRNWIEETLRRWCDEEELDLVLTIGGTNPAPGPSAAEVVPQATAAVVERPLPGLAQAMRAHAAGQSSLAWLDCGTSGIRGRSLLLNLPAGAAPALLFLEAVIDLIEPLWAHLHEPTTAPLLADELEVVEENPTPTEDVTAERSSVSTTSEQTSGLNAEEFAEFLQRRRNTTS